MNTYYRFGLAGLTMLATLSGCATETSNEEAEVGVEEDALAIKEVEGTFVSVRKGRFYYQDYSKDPDVRGLVTRNEELYLREVVVITPGKTFETHSDFSRTPNGPRVGIVQHDVAGTVQLDGWFNFVRPKDVLLRQSDASLAASRDLLPWLRYDVSQGSAREETALRFSRPGILTGMKSDPTYQTADKLCSAGCKRVAPGTPLPPISTLASLTAAERSYTFPGR